MRYKFPIIYTLDDVLPAIKDRKEFIVAEKDGYSVVNYVMQDKDTFPPVQTTEDAILRECRGLIFAPNGDLVSRPFHKFFNVGEKEETVNISLDGISLEKLDGSMIRPLLFDGQVRLATKMGITNVAMQAEEFIADKPAYIDFIRYICNKHHLHDEDNPITPIFEWCSRKQRIILDYPEDTLVLLALRYTYSGEYLPYEYVCQVAEKFGIPYVKTLNLDSVKDAEGVEGVVHIFEDGHKVKLKSDWYVRLHKAKDSIRQEKDLLLLIVNNELDDLKPNLSAEDLTRVEKYETDVKRGINRVLDSTAIWYGSIGSLFSMSESPSCIPRSDYAAAVKREIPQKYHHIMFKKYDQEFDTEYLLDMIRKICSTSAKLDDNRHLIGGVEYE